MMTLIVTHLVVFFLGVCVGLSGAVWVIYHDAKKNEKY
jgi:hypothetical protein